MLAAWWGGLPLLVQVLIGVMLLDITSGVLAAYITNSLDSRVSFRGMAKKALALVLVGVAAWIEPAVGIPLASAVAGFYTVHELLSILENAAIAGLPVPDALRDALARVPGGKTPNASS
jgi:toxin secretion/phage lysis holin